MESRSCMRRCKAYVRARVGVVGVRVSLRVHAGVVWRWVETLRPHRPAPPGLCVRMVPPSLK